MSPNLKRHQNWSFTKTELSPKLKCHQNWNFTKTEVLPNNLMSSKVQIRIQEIGTEYLGLVYKRLASHVFAGPLSPKASLIVKYLQTCSLLAQKLWCFLFSWCKDYSALWHCRNQNPTSASPQTGLRHQTNGFGHYGPSGPHGKILMVFISVAR